MFVYVVIHLVLLKGLYMLLFIYANEQPIHSGFVWYMQIKLYLHSQIANGKRCGLWLLKHRDNSETVFESILESKRKESQIMKFKASDNVHFFCVMSLFFDVIGHFYPRKQE